MSPRRFSDHETFRAIALCVVSTAIAVVASAATAPSAPRNVRAILSNEKITVNWDAPSTNGGSPITYFWVERSNSRDGAWRHAAYTSSSDYFKVTNGYPTEIRVQAQNAAGMGPFSETITVTAVGVPYPPADLRLAPKDSKVVARWQPPPIGDGGSPITAYTVTANPSGRKCSTADTHCTVTGLTNGVSYSFSVTASNKIGTGGPSPSVSATPNATATPPSEPLGLTKTGVTYNQVSLAWSKPSNNGGTALSGYRATASPGGKFCVTTGALACTVAGLNPSTTYSFVVTASNAAGTGPPSASISVLTSPPPTATKPGPPRNLRYTPYDGKVVVSWDPPVSDGGVPITSYRSEAKGMWHFTYTMSSDTFWIPNGTSIDVKVQAMNQVGAGDWSENITAWAGAAPPPPPPPPPTSAGTTTCGGILNTPMVGGQKLTPGTTIYTPNKQYRMIYQTDANLVIYAGTTFTATWATGTNFGNPGFAIMQTDGNLVLYDGASKPTWSSNTWNHPGAWLAFQNDGKLVVYEKGSCNPLWSSR